MHAPGRESSTGCGGRDSKEARREPCERRSEARVNGGQKERAQSIIRSDLHGEQRVSRVERREGLFGLLATTALGFIYHMIFPFKIGGKD